MKRMLINATYKEEIRVAFVDNQTLYDLDIESLVQEQRVESIYKARVVRVQDNLSSAFLDYGTGKEGFLSFKHLKTHRSSSQSTDEDSDVSKILSEGDEVLVQVIKDERRDKGAQLSTMISLKSHHLILYPNNPYPHQRRTTRLREESRQEIQAIKKALPLPEGVGVIVKQEAIGSKPDALEGELNLLLNFWKKIQQASEEHVAPCRLYQGDRSPIRVLRDYPTESIDEIVVDNPEIFDEIKTYIEWYMPEYKDKLVLHEDDLSLFKAYKIDKQISRAFDRTVKLPSGGNIAIDMAEALVAIDVNSAQAKGADSRETALKTNLEAAAEICRQIKIRDLSGLIVIDFIGMSRKEDQEDTEKVHAHMQKELSKDRALIRTADISCFGLMEIERQRLRTSLQETISAVCPTCEGQGHILNTETAALKILRQLEDQSLHDNVSKIEVKASPEVVAHIFNDKRFKLYAIERRHPVTIAITSESGRIGLDFAISGFDDSGKAVTHTVQQQGQSDASKTRRRRGQQVGAKTQAVVSKPKLQKSNTLGRWLRSLFSSKPKVNTDRVKNNKRGKGKFNQDSNTRRKGSGRRTNRVAAHNSRNVGSQKKKHSEGRPEDKRISGAESAALTQRSGGSAEQKASRSQSTHRPRQSPKQTRRGRQTSKAPDRAQDAATDSERGVDGQEINSNRKKPTRSRNQTQPAPANATNNSGKRTETQVVEKSPESSSDLPPKTANSTTPKKTSSRASNDPRKRVAQVESAVSARKVATNQDANEQKTKSASTTSKKAPKATASETMPNEATVDKPASKASSQIPASEATPAPTTNKAVPKATASEATPAMPNEATVDKPASKVPSQIPASTTPNDPEKK